MTILDASHVISSEKQNIVSSKELDASHVIFSEKQNIVTSSEHAPTVILSGPVISPISLKLSEMLDVDSTNLTDGSLLVYNSTNLNWKTTKQLNQQNIDCGEF